MPYAIYYPDADLRGAGLELLGAGLKFWGVGLKFGSWDSNLSPGLKFESHQIGVFRKSCT